jgi:hypothetical protein
MSSSNLGKGGKPKVAHGAARAAAVAASDAYLVSLRERIARFEDGHVKAQLVLEINGWGYCHRGVFSTAPPAATTGAAASRTSDFRPQFYITVGYGRSEDGTPFGNQRCLSVSNRLFFKEGEIGPRAKLVGFGSREGPIINEGDYVFSEARAGLATYQSSAGRAGLMDTHQVLYEDVMAVLTRDQAKSTGWILPGNKGLMRL